jgi:hypothetical protein
LSRLVLGRTGPQQQLLYAGVGPLVVVVSELGTIPKIAMMRREEHQNSGAGIERGKLVLAQPFEVLWVSILVFQVHARVGRVGLKHPA